MTRNLLIALGMSYATMIVCSMTKCSGKADEVSGYVAMGIVGAIGRDIVEKAKAKVTPPKEAPDAGDGK